MFRTSIASRHLVVISLAACVAILLHGCATGGVTTQPAEDTQPEVALVACTPQIRQADCPWRGSYPHVRAQHCEVSCQQDNASNYFVRFIDTCNDARLEEVCYSTVQNAGCQYYIDGGGRYVVTSNLGVPVGEDRNNGCASSNLSTVVLDGNYRVVTMYPGQ